MLALVASARGGQWIQKRDVFEKSVKVLIKALVAQWIERLVAVQKVAGPIPAKRTK